jgi:hypothetical protein
MIYAITKRKGGIELLNSVLMYYHCIGYRVYNSIEEEIFIY